MLTVEHHPLLDLRAFVTVFPRPLREVNSSPELLRLLSSGAPSPMQCDDAVRTIIRDLLRHGGFKPTGRSKPASEYLLKAAANNSLSSINFATDACNTVSLHSGLPISVIDLDLTRGPFRAAVASPGTSYIFNPSGQMIDLGGLLCLFDAEGPCASPVKDSQHTKTSPDTRRTLSVVWGSTELPGRAAEAEAWYHELLIRHGACVEPCKHA